MGYAMEPPIVFPQHRLPKGQKTVFRGGRGPKESFLSDFFSVDLSYPMSTEFAWTKMIS